MLDYSISKDDSAPSAELNNYCFINLILAITQEGTTELRITFITTLLDN